MYKISIVVPVYKVEKELDRCMQSLLKQTYQNIEILLVDDGSPDHCPEMCDAYGIRDPRVKVIHKKNGGLSEARNAGLQQAEGDYILYVDSDDYIDLDSCERFLQVIEGKDVDIVAGGAVKESSDGIETMLHTATPTGKIYSSKDFIEKSIRAYQWYAPAPFNIYKRDFLIKNGLYFKVGRYFEDMEMLPRVFLAADQIGCIDGVFYHYVVREDSIMTSEKNPKKEDDSIQNLTEWKVQFDGIQDKELKKYLHGMLLKCYLHECRVYGIKEWRIKGMGIRFSLMFGLDIKEKIKGVIFSLFPRKYVELQITK